jgi:hypothetical protein
LIADIQVWRAATQVEPSDLRPTGPPQPGYAARLIQHQLDKRLAATDTRIESHWRHLLAAEAPSATADPFLPELTERLSDLTRAGFDATPLLRSAAGAEPLPDDHPAAALWWRILDQLPAQTPKPDPNAQGRPSNKSHQQEVTRPTAILAVHTTTSRVRPEPLTPPSPCRNDGGRFPHRPLAKLPLGRPPELAERPYPWPVVGGLSCPAVLIRDITVREGCRQLSDLFGPPICGRISRNVGVRNRRMGCARKLDAE